MENSKINLLRSELDMAASYIDRLFHGLFDLSDLDYHPKLKKLLSSFDHELHDLLAKKVLPYGVIKKASENRSPNIFREHVNFVFGTIEHITRIGVEESFSDTLIEFINFGYRLGRELHVFVLIETDLAVELPRTICSEEVKPTIAKENLTLSEFLGPMSNDSDDDFEFDDWDEETLPLYQVTKEAVDESVHGGSILSFSMGTLKKSKELINKGHECVFEKKYPNALVFFEKARRLHETSETLTLIGWVYSLLDNLERAKKFCLKAIELDPDYGPAYNDIGSYLLQEGDINESIRWFKLAKAAPIYHNKEYPFINMGRALLMQKKYRQALHEFNEAKKLAPHQRQINDTILKIERLMETNDLETEKVKKPNFPFHQNLGDVTSLDSDLQ